MVATGVSRDLWRATEFSYRHNQGVVQQAAFRQVIEQRRKSTIQYRSVPISHVLKIQPMGIPSEIGPCSVDVLDVLTPVDLHERHLRLDQPPRQQAPLAEHAGTVPSPGPVRLSRQIKHSATFDRCQQSVCPGKTV